MVDIHTGQEIKWEGLEGRCNRAPKTYKEETVSTVSNGEVFSSFTGVIMESPLNLIFTTYLCVWPGSC